MERTLCRVGNRRGQVARRYADLATQPLHVRPAAVDDVDAVLDEGAGDAGYVHRLAVCRAQSGRGLGHRLLDWADGATRASGRTRLRLDVVSDNEPLRRYYEEAGFAHQRDVEGEFVLADGTRRQWRTSLYERPCAGGGA
jgi:ribosomal protein S18 acetylase RimI-like enzyme